MCSFSGAPSGGRVQATLRGCDAASSAAIPLGGRAAGGRPRASEQGQPMALAESGAWLQQGSAVAESWQLAKGFCPMCWRQDMNRAPRCQKSAALAAPPLQQLWMYQLLRLHGPAPAQSCCAYRQTPFKCWVQKLASSMSMPALESRSPSGKVSKMPS